MKHLTIMHVRKSDNEATVPLLLLLLLLLVMVELTVVANSSCIYIDIYEIDSDQQSSANSPGHHLLRSKQAGTPSAQTDAVKTDQFRCLFQIANQRSERPILAQPSLSRASPGLTLKLYQCWSG